jgi:putative oxidoreductase
MESRRFAGIVWPLYRVVIGLLFACHGLASIFGVLGGNKGTGGTVPTGTWPGWYAALIQIVCGGLVLIGLLTRPAALLASGSMAYAYFVVHQQNALMPIQNGGMLPALYSWSFLLIAAFGAGAFSIDALFSRRRTETVEAKPEPAPALS